MYGIIHALHSCTLKYSVYCKRGYFRWGEISRKCWKDISREDSFHDTTNFSFINNNSKKK